MKAITIANPNDVEIVEMPQPEPAEGEVVIKVMACGICGTDIHIFRGEYMGKYPVIPGHEFSGVVERVGRGVAHFKPGNRVAVEPNISCQNCRNCLNNRENFCENWQAVGVTRPGGMAQYVAVPESAVFDIGDIPFEIAAFMEPLSCVLHGIERVGIRMGDRVLILGAGPIGILLLKSVLLRGVVEVTVVEKNPARREFAQRSGAQKTFPDLRDPERDYFDVVIDATGVIEVMARTIDFARHGGAVLLFGVPPAGKTMQIEPFTIFRKGLTVLSSFTSLRNSYQSIDLLSSSRIDASSLISHRLPLDQFQHGVETIEQVSDNVMKVVILPNG